MIDVGLMIEGQQGVTWPRWQRIALAVEEAGYAGLYRSDHFTDPEGPHLDALELWTSLTWAAANTARISLGPVVAPVSFRDPRIAVWQAAAIHALAPGRLRLGLGAGWNEREHDEWGFDLLGIDDRFQRFTEALEIATRLARTVGPVSYSGKFYTLKDAEIVPNPISQGMLPIVVGGNGPRRTLPLAARYADEWNGVYIDHDTFRARNQLLDDLLREEGRQPAEVRRTLMTRIIFGRDEHQLAERLAGENADELRAAGQIVGTAAEIPDQLRAWEAAGVQGIMLQWVDDLDDILGITALGRVAARGI
ncbi:MAG: LLM class flavin-dependent oxidoreductase [Chloroflexota bacterium]|nr:LLM class flavin-dependent oxidoreductase [Chloroflexota bacterium]